MKTAAPSCTVLAALAGFVTAGDFGDGTAKNGAASNEGRIYAHAIVLTYELSDRASSSVERDA
jgi:hypothetical protein